MQGRLRHLTYLRNIAIVEMLRATGARPRELVALRRGDLDELNQVARAPDGRHLYFDLASWAALARYLEARRDPVFCAHLLSQVPLFARHDLRSAGQGLQPLAAARVGKILKGLRSTEMLTARALRIRFGQRLLAATADEKGTAKLLGIKGLVPVRLYRER
jgi:site-specific recombinase XerD